MKKRLICIKSDMIDKSGNGSRGQLEEKYMLLGSDLKESLTRTNDILSLPPKKENLRKALGEGAK